jgi:sucrose-6-phosphate hydrolase SacC (GH32 family)
MNAAFDHGELHELDAGFEFYAPQTTLAEDGRRILIGWMGVPDGEEMLQPTRAHGWMHQMTCPRELRYRDGKLWQTRRASWRRCVKMSSTGRARQRCAGSGCDAPGV